MLSNVEELDNNDSSLIRSGGHVQFLSSSFDESENPLTSLETLMCPKFSAHVNLFTFLWQEMSKLWLKVAKKKAADRQIEKSVEYLELASLIDDASLVEDLKFTGKIKKKLAKAFFKKNKKEEAVKEFKSYISTHKNAFKVSAGFGIFL